MPRDKHLDRWEATEVTAELPGGSWDHRGNIGVRGRHTLTSPRPLPSDFLLSASLWPNLSGSQLVRTSKKCSYTVGISEGRVGDDRHFLMLYLQMAFKEKQAYLSQVGDGGIRRQGGTIWRQALLSDSAGGTVLR